eukprot:g1402.t1
MSTVSVSQLAAAPATETQRAAESYLTGQAARRLDALPFGFGRKHESYYHHVNEADRKLGRGVPDLPTKPLTYTRSHKRVFTIWRAAENGDRDRVELLLSRGALIDDRDDLGRTPLHWAARADRSEVATYLLSCCEVGTHHTYVNQPDLKGNTALHLAAGWGSELVVRAVLENGGDNRLKNDAGFLPEELANEMGRAESAALLNRWEPPGGLATYDKLNRPLLKTTAPRTLDMHTSPMAMFTLQAPGRKPILSTGTGELRSRQRQLPQEGKDGQDGGGRSSGGGNRDRSNSSGSGSSSSSGPSGTGAGQRRSIFGGRLFDIRKLDEPWTNQLDRRADPGGGLGARTVNVAGGDLAETVWASYVRGRDGNVDARRAATQLFAAQGAELQPLVGRQEVDAKIKLQLRGLAMKEASWGMHATGLIPTLVKLARLHLELATVDSISDEDKQKAFEDGREHMWRAVAIADGAALMLPSTSSSSSGKEEEEEEDNAGFPGEEAFHCHPQQHRRHQ